jgi:hypothetical protein
LLAQTGWRFIHIPRRAILWLQCGFTATHFLGKIHLFFYLLGLAVLFTLLLLLAQPWPACPRPFSNCLKSSIKCLALSVYFDAGMMPPTLRHFKFVNISHA